MIYILATQAMRTNFIRPWNASLQE